MAKIIKLTYRQLREAEGSDFTYLDTDNDKASCDGKSQISVDGKIDNDTVGDTTTNDKIASVLTPQSYNRFHSYGSLYGRNMREGVDINKDNVDDFYNNDELDILSNGDINDNLTKIPQGVEYKTDVLIDAIDTLQPKQQAIVLNKILENLDMSSIPYMWKKELIRKLMTNNKNETK